MLTSAKKVNPAKPVAGRILHQFLRHRAAALPSVPLFAERVASFAAVELTRMGDLIASTYAINALQKAIPDTQIFIITRKIYKSLAAALVSNATVEGISNGTPIRTFLEARAKLRAIGPTFTCSMSVGRLNSLAALASGSKFIGGYLAFEGTKAPYLHATRTESFGFPTTLGSVQPARLSTRPGALLDMMGLSQSLMPNKLVLNPEMLAAARSTLREGISLPAKRYVVIHPFSGWEYRNWPIEHYQELIQRIVSADELPEVIVVAEEQQRELALRLFGRLKKPERAHLYLSRDLLTSAVLIHDAELYIGNDSGPLHLAAAFGVPAVGLYGPAGPEQTGPVSYDSALFRAMYFEFPCSPCAQEFCPHGDRWCMTRITVNDVSTAVRQLLSSHRSSSATHA